MTPQQLAVLAHEARERYAQTIRRVEAWRRWQRLWSTLKAAAPEDRWVTVCAYCRRFRDRDDDWRELPTWVTVRVYPGVEITHGVCPDCMLQLEDEQ